MMFIIQPDSAIAGNRKQIANAVRLMALTLVCSSKVAVWPENRQRRLLKEEIKNIEILINTYKYETKKKL